MEDGLLDKNQANNAIKTFFAEFEQASNTFDGDLLASHFSDPSMSADPEGRIHIVKTDDLLAVTAKRRAFFQSIGFQLVKIAVLDETQLDDHYVMAKVHVHMRFEKEPGKPVDVKNDNTYILFVKDDSPRIVFNLTHEDITKVMQKHGLLPAKP
jgi:ketosteroid isomerase-like protein